MVQQQQEVIIVRTTDDGTCHKICGLGCAYFIPPLGVFWQYGCGFEFFLCFLLTLCGYLPGVIYACCVIAGDDRSGYTYYA